MADVLKKVQRGQPLVIPASTYNAFVNAAQDYQRRKLSQESTGLSTSRDADMVLVKNASGGGSINRDSMCNDRLHGHASVDHGTRQPMINLYQYQECRRS